MALLMLQIQMQTLHATGIVRMTYSSPIIEWGAAIIFQGVRATLDHKHVDM